MTDWSEKKLAVWAMTPNAAELAQRVRAAWPGVELYFSSKLKIDGADAEFTSFSRTLGEAWSQYDGHYFIMATGIVVRVIANLMEDKTKDPAVICGDEAGHFVISLVSGHIGGANELARELASILDAQPVITTSTDVNHAPSIDVIASDHGLHIENKRAIKHVSMAYIKGQALPMHDPYNLVKPHIPRELIEEPAMFTPTRSGVFVDYEVRDLPGLVLVLRPKCLVAGIGCRRGVSKQELETHVREVFKAQGLSIHSLARIVSVDLKADEPGLLQLAEDLDVPIHFYSTDELDQVKMVPNPSPLVDKHIGVKSVCEAAAILATGRRNLITPKQASKTATVAIAAMPFT
ncbi:cobalt-precorrin 5A hydrolase [Desulfatibacillum aliphaticivorans]|uniref:cobalt-precorrin 5A hydrolase n=1 Tax=Desulfatibacillum aliphaticivorans TaxID=218208 RepID=UPI00040A94B7|nr:cobalt-precorrin 5A hydrolase [Desulfatibacillum aliphaticivorans]